MSLEVRRQQADVCVVGAGHAGCEAALAAARAGGRVLVITLRLDGIGQMSCNPAIGGVAKGHLVREIDALGGAMGEVADQTALSARRLNASRGAAVRSTRVQTDQVAYRRAMAARLTAARGVEVWEGEVVGLEAPRGAHGPWTVALASGAEVAAGAVVVTAGTFMAGMLFVGDERTLGGRAGERPVAHLSGALAALGLRLERFKTGTTPRLAADSVEVGDLKVQWGDTPAPRFAGGRVAPTVAPLPCHLTTTLPATHRVVRAHLHLSPLAQGHIAGRGPRYCPSLEDKVVRFADRDRHLVFLEPESHLSDHIYPGGLSTSLPRAAQEAFVRTVPGLARARILRHGYAVEYDFAPPTQLTSALMVRRRPGLFLAGQINGTSGYEEAAAQGLMAGLNAARWVEGASPAVLGRHEAYIGVLVDDLVHQGVDEPYRMFTARAEHRLNLRESNAEARLAGRALAWGLWGADRRAAFAASRRAHAATLARVEAARWRAEMAPCLPKGAAPPAAGTPLPQVLRRPEIALAALWPALGGDASTPPAILEEVGEAIAYAPFIAREVPHIRRLGAIDDVALPADLDYRRAQGLSNEASEKLAHGRPATLAQAARIPGIDPATLSILRVLVRRAASLPRLAPDPAEAQGAPDVSRETSPPEPGGAGCFT